MKTIKKFVSRMSLKGAGAWIYLVSGWGSLVVWMLILLVSCGCKKPSPILLLKPNKVDLAFKYCKENNMDTTICILVDFSVSSKYQRMKVIDMQTKKTLSQGLVCHGMGLKYTKDPIYSNVKGSHLSSLGKYKIAERGYSNWGINVKYVLDGLETTNNNARKRDIVLHSWGAIPNATRTRYPIVQGYGCPAVSNKYMKQLDKVLKDKKSVLLWIYK